MASFYSPCNSIRTGIGKRGKAERWEISISGKQNLVLLLEPSNMLLQNRAARIVTNSSYDAPAVNLLKELKRPTVPDIIKQETATNVFKSIYGLAPTYLSTLFTRNATREIVSLRTSETDLLLPRMKMSNGQKAFSFCGAKVWNEPEQGIKLAPSLSTFKRRFSNK